ncbi:hypothetical protein RJ639_002938 [Escallonia herrerae]|uniref:Calcium homeostasis endoplasmic reticulum protein n=1 Tax=Escallonia herrerae TaxID=1293975 RepID=A0AA89AWQ6_9ASTE|nr:hypothetical protein RJ639_002938 [Escallonia herrerae]
MDRQAHDYAAAMAFAQQQQQQQQQFGFPPQLQQFPPSVHGPPYLSPHPSLQQFPYHRHMQQPPLHPHAPPHLLHLQQPPSAFPPHLPPHLMPSSFLGPYESPPPTPPPSDPELQKCIDKLVEYAAKNGPEFEAMIREKQKNNPVYSFLFGGEGHNYYRYKLWLSTRPPAGPFNPGFPSSPMLHPPPNPMMTPPPLNGPQLNASPAAPQMHQPPFPPFYEQQHHQSFVGHGLSDYDQSSRNFKGLSGPLPSDVAMELNNVLNNLTGTKESIKGAKIWFMQRSPFAPALAEALKERVIALDDSERQLHIIYLANDILFDRTPMQSQSKGLEEAVRMLALALEEQKILSAVMLPHNLDRNNLQRRINPHDLDNEALAFKPVLGSMLARIYHNPQNKEENQLRLQKILQFWASKEVYDNDAIRGLDNEMMGGPPTTSFHGSQNELSAISTDPLAVAGLPLQASNRNALHWQQDKASLVPNLLDQEHADKQIPSISAIPPSLSAPQFLPNSGGYAGSIPMPSAPLANQPPPGPHVLPAPPAANTGEKLPPYPLFPPGLIPGMVRKMQIGSGVPYSPMSPLDIPTVIPPSSVSQSEILGRVSKFYREIGELNPCEGPISADSDDPDDEYVREPLVRKGGACIPPPPNLQVDPETGTYPDGSVERIPGASSSGRLGLGATANPNEASQYDDVYSSYRKQRSTNYHSSMSARASTK